MGNSSRRLLAGAGAIALVGIGAGVSVAATSSSSPTVRACENAKTHVLSVAGTGGSCTKGSKKLSWSVQGPAGPAGASAGVTWSTSTHVVPSPADTAMTVMTSPSVPKAGVYYVSASLQDYIGLNDLMACVINGDNAATWSYVGPTTVSPGTFEEMPLSGAVQVAAGGKITISCLSQDGLPGTEFYDGTATAVLIANSTG